MKTGLVNQSVKFSYNIAKGSVEERVLKTQQFDEQFYSMVMDFRKQNSTNFLPIDDFKKFVTALLPENQLVRIGKIPKNSSYEAYSEYLLDSRRNLLGQVLRLPLTKKNQLRISDLPTAIHEITHIFDKMINPKIIARIIKLSRELEGQIGIYNQVEKYSKIDVELTRAIQKAISTEEEKQALLKTMEDDIRKLLKNNSLRTKLNILQNLRYQLLLELNAIQTENNFIERMNAIGIKTSYEKNDMNEYLYEEKIDMLKRLILELIKKERRKIRKSCNNQLA